MTGYKNSWVFEDMGNLLPGICLTEGFKNIYVIFCARVCSFLPSIPRAVQYTCPVIKVRINHDTIHARLDREILLERAFCALWVIEQGILHLECTWFASYNEEFTIRINQALHMDCTNRITLCPDVIKHEMHASQVLRIWTGSNVESLYRGYDQLLLKVRNSAAVQY